MGDLIGIDLGGTKIEGVVLGPERTVRHRVRVPTESARGYRHIVMRVAEVVSALRGHAPGCRRVGIGTPGSLSRQGTLKNSNTTCLNGRPLLADLEAALPTKTELGRHHATLFTPDSGDLGGKFFLVVDVNNRAGYQAGDDFVVQLTDFIGSFSNAIFI